MPKGRRTCKTCKALKKFSEFEKVEGKLDEVCIECRNCEKMGLSPTPFKEKKKTSEEFEQERLKRVAQYRRSLQRQKSEVGA